MVPVPAMARKDYLPAVLRSSRPAAVHRRQEALPPEERSPIFSYACFSCWMQGPGILHNRRADLLPRQADGRADYLIFLYALINPLVEESCDLISSLFCSSGR